MRLLLTNKISEVLSRLRSSALFRDSFWALLGGVLGKGLSFGVGIFVARLLGSYVYGEYGVIRSTLTYLAIISTFGLGYTATKYIAEYADSNRTKVKSLVHTIRCITLLTGLFFTVIQAAYAEQIAEFLKAPHLFVTIRRFSILTLLNAITTSQLSILAGLKKFKNVANINIITGIITFVLSVGLSYYFGLNGALTALLLAFVVQIIVSEMSIYIQIKDFDAYEKITVKELNHVLFYSLPVALQDSFYAVAHWLSTYMLLLFASYAEVGLLNAATIWQSLVVSIPAMLKNVMLSHLSSVRDSKIFVKKFFVVNLFASAIPAFFIIIMSGHIENVYGNTYDGIHLIIVVISLSSILICLGEVFVYELVAKNKSWLVFISRFIRDVITLSFSYYILHKVSHSQALVYAIVALAMHLVYLVLIYGMYKTIKHDKEIC